MPQGDSDAGFAARSLQQPHSGAVATAYPRPGLSGLIHSGGSDATSEGWTPDQGDLAGPSNFSLYDTFSIPEQSGLVLPEDDHPASDANVKALHDEMDALLAGASQQKLT